MSEQTANKECASCAGPEYSGIPTDLRLSSYSFELPEQFIAQEPPVTRGASRLMLVDRRHGEPPVLSHYGFSEIVSLLPKGSLLVANNARVIPARLTGMRDSGGKMEFLLLTPLPALMAREMGDNWHEAAAEGLLKPSKRLAMDQALHFAPDIEVIPRKNLGFGRAEVTLRWRGNLAAALERVGHLPLPPYIKRPNTRADFERYQTVYANSDKIGAVAAPTAGLHFTPELKNAILAAGHEWAEITLFVGYGTFSPVRAEDIRDHAMHGELVEIGRKTAERVACAKKEGRPIVAVGTTAVRALEGAYAAAGGFGEFKGITDIFLYPGKKLNVVDHLITNFHLPESTLLMLVSVMTGRENLLAAYQEAIAQKYRFFSYGDAMFIR